MRGLSDELFINEFSFHTVRVISLWNCRRQVIKSDENCMKIRQIGGFRFHLPTWKSC